MTRATSMSQARRLGGWYGAMRQGSGARLRNWGLAQGPGEQVSSGPLGRDWRGRLEVRGLAGDWDEGPGEEDKA